MSANIIVILLYSHNAVYPVYNTGIHTNVIRGITDGVTLSYIQYLQSIPFIPGKYCPRISTQSQQQLVDHFISAVSQIAYPNETHDNKNTDSKCSSLIFSHRQNPGRMLMTQIPSATREVLSQLHYTHIKYNIFTTYSR